MLNERDLKMAKDALQLVYNLREKEVDEALHIYQKAITDLFAQRKQLQTLHDYKSQYISQLTHKGSVGLSIGELNKFQQFILQIDQGITSNQEGLIKYEYDVHNKKQLWRESQIKCKAMAILLEKKAKEKAKQEDRKEQQLSDEFAMFQFFQKTQEN